MSRSHIVIGLVLALILQLVLLGGILASATLPLWTGQEIKVKTIPVDPRSLFRGNYARLGYEFSSIPASTIATDRLRQNEPVFVSLQAGEDGLYTFAAVSTNKPDHGVFIRGRATRRNQSLAVRYGIEAWFAPPDKALQLEKDLRDGGVAVLMVTNSGKVALKEILPLQ